MKSTAALAIFVALIAPGASWSQQNANHETVVTSFLTALKEGAAAVEKIENKGSAEAATAALTKQAGLLRDMAVQANKLGAPSREEAARLDKKYKPEIEAGAKRVQAAVQKLPEKLKELDLPPDTKNALGVALQDYGQAMIAFITAMGKWDKR